MEEILERLYEPFTPDLIKTRKGPRNMDLSYIESHEVITRLNNVLGLSWDFTIDSHSVEMEQVQVRDREGNVELQNVATVVVFGTLTVNAIEDESGSKRSIRRSQCGTQVNRDGYENSFKAAASDCLKKCATLFGVALHLYGGEKPAGSSQTSPPSSSTPERIERPATEKQVNFIKSLTKTHGNLEKVNEIHKELSVGITAARASTIIEFLKESQMSVEELIAKKEAERPSNDGSLARSEEDGLPF